MLAFGAGAARAAPDAMIWAIRNQFGRRNLTTFQRCELALVLEPMIAARAKANERAGGGSGPSGAWAVNGQGLAPARAESVFKTHLYPPEYKVRCRGQARRKWAADRCAIFHTGGLAAAKSYGGGNDVPRLTLG